MESNDKLLFEISELITKASDRSISDEEFDRLQHLIRTDAKALEYYYDIVTTFSCLGDIKKIDFDAEEKIDEKNRRASKSDVDLVADGNVPFISVDLQRVLSDEKEKPTTSVDKSEDVKVIQALQELAVHEKAAPHIEIHEEKPEEELIQKVVYPPQEKLKVSKFQIFTLTTSAAAILFIVLFVTFFPKPLPTRDSSLRRSVSLNLTSRFSLHFPIGTITACWNILNCFSRLNCRQRSHASLNRLGHFPG